MFLILILIFNVKKGCCSIKSFVIEFIARRRRWRVARRGVGARGAGVRESMTSSGGEHRGVRVFLVVGQKALRGAAGGHWPDASAAVHADWLTELWAPPQAPSTFLGAIPTSII